MKSRGGKSQRREEKKKVDQRRESLRRKKIQVREKVGKSRNTVFFQWFEAPEGRKVGSLKRRVRSQLARWEMKNCTPLWREAHFQVKMYKTHQVWTTFGSCDVEKVHAVVARSTFRSQNVQNTPGLDHFWKLRCRKSARRCGAKHISKSKCTKHQVRTTFGSWDVRGSDHFWTFSRFAWQAHGIVHLVKSQQNMRVFFSISKNDGRPGTFEEDLRRCIFRGRRSTRDMFIRAVRRSGRWFPEMGCILEHQIFMFAEMILRNRCSTSYDPVSLFHGRRSSLDRWSGTIAKRIGTRPSALHSTSIFEGSLAELLRFWCCQLRKLRKSRRIASFLTLSSAKNQEVLQNSFVLDGVKFKNWGSLAE